MRWSKKNKILNSLLPMRRCRSKHIFSCNKPFKLPSLVNALFLALKRQELPPPAHVDKFYSSRVLYFCFFFTLSLSYSVNSGSRRCATVSRVQVINLCVESVRHRLSMFCFGGWFMRATPVQRTWQWVLMMAPREQEGQKRGGVEGGGRCQICITEWLIHSCSEDARRNTHLHH